MSAQIMSNRIRIHMVIECLVAVIQSLFESKPRLMTKMSLPKLMTDWKTNDFPLT